MIDSYLKNGELFVAELNNEIVGVLVLYSHEQQVEIKNIAVAENHQNKGIGKLLLNYATERAKNTGYAELIIGTANSSIHQLYLYQKVGFELKEIRKHFFTDHYQQPIVENGIVARHLVILSKKL